MLRCVAPKKANDEAVAAALLAATVSLRCNSDSDTAKSRQSTKNVARY